jgi:cytochrome P450
MTEARTDSLFKEDPLSPPEPCDARFDPALDAWVLSRHSDVVAAFRKTRLWPASPQGRKPPKTPDAAAQERIRAEIQTISASRLSHWRGRLEAQACEMAAGLAGNRSIDLVGELADPWCLAAAEVVVESSEADRERLLAHARVVSDSAAEPLDEDLQSRATLAGKQLEKILATSAIPMPGATFVALSRTLSRLLANGWLALLRHPGQLASLRARPDLVPRAVEEIFRLAGIPQSLFRHAGDDLEVNGLRIARGQRVVLMLASANRDRAQFADPDRFDLHRNCAGSVSLGLGPHSCVGGSLIRMAAAVATRAFADRFAEAEINCPIEWSGGSGFRSASSLWVTGRSR